MARPKSKNPPTEQQYREYFASHVTEATDGSGCYLWTAAKNNIGYGLFRYGEGMKSAHRVAMIFEGKDIEGKVVYHSCDNYNCVNPQHLNIGTLHDKAQVMVSKGRAGTAWSDPKYHRTCKYCGYVGSPGVVAHHHNDNCKMKP